MIKYVKLWYTNDFKESKHHRIIFMLIIVILITYKENKTCTINKLAFIMTKSSHTTTSQLNYEDKSSVKEYFMNEDKSMKHSHINH